MVYGQCDDPRYRDDPIDVLYNLENDPGETVDLAGNPEFESVKREMNRVLHDWLDQTGWKGKPVLRY